MEGLLMRMKKGMYAVNKVEGILFRIIETLPRKVLEQDEDITEG